MKNPEATLADIEAAIAAHAEGFNHDAVRPCRSMLLTQEMRAQVLKRLGRAEEAEAAQALAETPAGEYPVTIYDAFHERLRQLTTEDAGIKVHVSK